MMAAQRGHLRAAPKNRAAEISAARKAAFNILLAVERGHGHSDDLLRGKAVNALSAADRNLATALVLGVLRWQIRLDHEIKSMLTRPNAKLEAEIEIALRLGAFQILRMDRIPARAAIDESVELAKQSGHRFASAMVNAVLRKLTAPLKAESSHEPSADLASGEAHPAWMVERWISFYGLDTARAICRHGQIQPQLAIRLASNDAEAELNEAGVSAETGRLVASARIVTAGDVASTSAFREGRIRMQDEGSQLVAEVAAANLTVASGRILDACAAPGGKTLILAERHPQALIVACDSSPARLEQMRKRLSAQAGRIEFRQADASELTDDAAFDLVLTDVPCSGTGTLGRNPEIRHRLRPQDISRQAERQRAILTAALRAVRSGGRVVYSTCSLEPEENEQVIAAVRAANPNVQAIPLHASIELLQSASVLLPASAEQLKAAITPEGALRLFPEMFNTDGFFMAILERGK